MITMKNRYSGSTKISNQIVMETTMIDFAITIIIFLVAIWLVMVVLLILFWITAGIIMGLCVLSDKIAGRKS